MAYAPESSLVLAAADYEQGARERLVDTYLPHIAGMARAYSTSEAVDRAELMQEGVVGLLRAADRYDATIGAPFWAYASWWVRQAMQHLVAELRWPSALSDRALRHLARVKDAQREQLQKTGGELSTADLADETGFTAEHIQQLMAIDRTARDIIDGEGYGENFFHRTGHGIGLEGHEEPYLIAGNAEPIGAGMAFSVEPGIYLPGKFGARIEDIVVCGPDGPIVLNNEPRELRVVSG